MLLAWQNEELEEATLSDSDCGEDECDSDGGPVAKYATEEQYSLYVIHPISCQDTLEMHLRQAHETAADPLYVSQRHHPLQTPSKSGDVPEGKL